MEAADKKLVAVIDIGASAIRMVIGEVDGRGGVRVLENLEQAVQLGRDVFRRGKIRRETVRRALNAIQGYRRVIDTYGVDTVRAVGTSALREASNRDSLLDPLLWRFDLDVEVIEGSMERRLLFSAVHEVLEKNFDLGSGAALIVEVGGGNTEITVLRDGEVAASHTLPLGSLRLQEDLASPRMDAEHYRQLLRRQVERAVERIQHIVPVDGVRLFAAVGGEVRFTVNHLTQGQPEGYGVVSLEAFNAFVEEVARHHPDTLAIRWGITHASAETLLPALLVYATLLRCTEAEEVVVPTGNLREGLLLDLAAEMSGRSEGGLTRLVRTSAVNLGRKYHFDEAHALHTAGLALQLFDLFAPEHRLGARERFLLEVGAILHDIGNFIHTRRHHQHGDYIVRASEIFGLGRQEHLMVASMVRYHRKSMPKTTDPGFAALPRRQQRVLLQLTALLRVADVLDRSGQQRVSELRLERHQDRMVLRAVPQVDLYFERVAFQRKAALFEQILGITLELD